MSTFAKSIRFALSILLAAMLAAFVMPVTAYAQSPALMAHSYSGSYRAGARRGTVSFTVTRGIRPGMWEGTAVLNGQQMYSNGISQADGSMIVNFFTLDANYNQIQIASMKGTFSPDSLTFSGPFTMKGKTGRASLKAQ
jgi:hypothetical protein